MFCKVCGSKNDDDATYCSGCGSKINEKDKLDDIFLNENDYLVDYGEYDDFEENSSNEDNQQNYNNYLSGNVRNQNNFVNENYVASGMNNRNNYIQRNQNNYQSNQSNGQNANNQVIPRYSGSMNQYQSGINNRNQYYSGGNQINNQNINQGYNQFNNVNRNEFDQQYNGENLNQYNEQVKNYNNQLPVQSINPNFNNQQFYDGSNFNNNSQSKPPKDKWKIVDLLSKMGSYIGIIGIVLFLSVVSVNGIANGEISLLSSSHPFVRAMIRVSMVLMFIGIVGFILRLIVSLKFKTKKYFLNSSLATCLIVLAIAFNSWAFVDLGISKSKNNPSVKNEQTNNSSSDVIDFYQIYLDCGCASPWASWTSDSLSIDTNPGDYSSSNSNSTKYVLVAYSAIEKINNKLGFPTSVFTDMMQTSASNGRLDYSNSKVYVFWRYHPNHGLEVSYSLI